MNFKRIFFVFCGCYILSLMTGCSPKYETITQNEGNYVYVENEAINIIDIATNSQLGTLMVTSIDLLKDELFTIKEYTGNDESGQAIYEDVTYNQLVRVNYSYKVTVEKKLLSSNFRVLDTDGFASQINPRVDFDTASADSPSFMVALQGKRQYLEMEFRFDIFQSRQTAKLKISIAGQDSSNANVSQNASSETPLSSTQNSSPSALKSEADSASNFSAISFGLNIVLGILVVILVAMLISKKRS